MALPAGFSEEFLGVLTLFFTDKNLPSCTNELLKICITGSHKYEHPGRTFWGIRRYFSGSDVNATNAANFLAKRC